MTSKVLSRLLYLGISAILVSGCVRSSKKVAEPAPKAPPVQEPIESQPEVEPMSAAEKEARSYQLGNDWWVPAKLRDEGHSQGDSHSRLVEITSGKRTPLAVGPGKTQTSQALADHLRAEGETGALSVVAVHRPQTSRSVVLIDGELSKALTWWSSEGAEAANAGTKLEALLSSLVSEHQVDCIGTMGSSATSMRRSESLENVQERLVRLTGLFEQVLFELAIEDSRIVPAARLILEMLSPHLENHLRMLDPAGWVVQRAKTNKPILRFGLDSNQVVTDRRELKAEKWLLRTEWLRLGGRIGPEDKPLQNLFANEFDDFRDNFILPIEESLSELRRSKIRLRRDGADSEAALIGQFVGHVRLVLDQVLELSKAVAYQEFVSTRRRGLKKKDRKRLRAAIKGTRASYERLVTQKASDSAVDNTLARLAEGAHRCVVLIEPSDVKGVLRKFIQRAPDDVGLVVLGIGQQSP